MEKSVQDPQMFLKDHSDTLSFSEGKMPKTHAKNDLNVQSHRTFFFFFFSVHVPYLIVQDFMLPTYLRTGEYLIYFMGGNRTNRPGPIQHTRWMDGWMGIL